MAKARSLAGLALGNNAMSRHPSKEEEMMLSDSTQKKPVQSQQQVIDYLIPRKTVEEMSGLSKATIYRLIKARKFPPPRSIGTGAVRWKLSDVIAWQQSLNPSL